MSAKFCFEMRKIQLPLSQIMPVRLIKDPAVTVGRYKAILASIKDVGLIEPLMVHPQRGKSRSYLLVDGHLRYAALKELGYPTADCIIATDDESFTFNARINRLSPIQEHRMIAKAVKNGVKLERIASTLDMPIKTVRAYVNLLDGINNEAAELLKDKPISPSAIQLLRRVSGVRQIEIAELMVSSNNYTASYAEGLLLNTPKEQIIQAEKPSKRRLSAEESANMQAEMQTVEREFRMVKNTYGEHALQLTVIRSYVTKLLANATVLKYLCAKHPDLRTEFEAIAKDDKL